MQGNYKNTQKTTTTIHTRELQHYTEDYNNTLNKTNNNTHKTITTILTRELQQYTEDYNNTLNTTNNNTHKTITTILTRELQQYTEDYNNTHDTTTTINTRQLKIQHIHKVNFSLLYAHFAASIQAGAPYSRTGRTAASYTVFSASCLSRHDILADLDNLWISLAHFSAA